METTVRRQIKHGRKLKVWYAQIHVPAPIRITPNKWWGYAHTVTTVALGGFETRQQAQAWATAVRRLMK